jgi:hypothetical protein
VKSSCIYHKAVEGVEGLKNGGGTLLVSFLLLVGGLGKLTGGLDNEGAGFITSGIITSYCSFFYCLSSGIT